MHKPWPSPCCTSLYNGCCHGVWVCRRTSVLISVGIWKKEVLYVCFALLFRNHCFPQDVESLGILLWSLNASLWADSHWWRHKMRFGTDDTVFYLWSQNESGAMHTPKNVCVHSYATGVGGGPWALGGSAIISHGKETAALRLYPTSSRRICCSQISQCLLVLSMWTFSTIFSLNLFYFLEKGSYCITWMAWNTLCRPCWS